MIVLRAMEIVNYFKGSCGSLTPTKGEGNWIDGDLGNSPKLRLVSSMSLTESGLEK